MKNILLPIFCFILFPLVSKASIEVLGALSNIHTGKPGDSYTEIIKVRNNSDIEQEVKIYQTDYSFNYQGKSFYNEPGSQIRSNARWIEFNPKVTILKGKETRNIQYSVIIPSTDILVGTYWSMLMIEGVNQINPEHKRMLNIQQSFRYAIQIVTNIGNTGLGMLEFQHPNVVIEGDKTYFDLDLLNTGQRMISPVVSMEIFDEKTAKSVKVIRNSQKVIYPTTSKKFKFLLEGIPTGKTYKAVIVADGSGDDVFGLEYTIVL